MSFLQLSDQSPLTPRQIRELQDALNGIAGDERWRHKMIVLPPGASVTATASWQCSYCLVVQDHRDRCWYCGAPL